MSIKPKFNFLDNDLKVLDIKHRPYPQTKEEFISEHRKMWHYIKEEIIKYNCLQNIEDLKQAYIRANFGFKYVRNNCFLCDYVSYTIEGTCRVCPLYSGKAGLCLDGLFLRVTSTRDWKTQAELADQISLLPEVQ